MAAHLMGCQRQIVRGLARKSPWAGLSDETLDSCFGHAAAVVARIAASGERSAWQTPRDLEKAQIAAFRHQALDHWKRVNAQSRKAERFNVAFDPDRHGEQHAPMDRLFEQPDLHLIERDLLAELGDDRLLAFWTIVLRDQVSFKTAGDRLQLSKSAVMSCTRAGRTAFANYLERRASGQLCRERGLDIAEHRAGTATPWRTERAEAHLESCYACALVHDSGTSAIQRGILGAAPTGVLLRLIARAGDVASAPIVRAAQTGSGSRTVAAGLAALSVAGASVELSHRGSSTRHSHATTPQPKSAPPSLVGGPFKNPTALEHKPPSRADRAVKTSARFVSPTAPRTPNLADAKPPKSLKVPSSPPVAPPTAPRSEEAGVAEFVPEIGRDISPAQQDSNGGPASSSNAPANEFNNP